MEIEKIKRDLLNADPNQIQEHLKKIQQKTQQSFVDLDQYCDFKVEIKPLDSVSPGKFKPSSIYPGIYFAHPQTIMAMKKNILMAGDQFADLEMLYKCEACNTLLDVQFWHFCPYCAEKFPF